MSADLTTTLALSGKDGKKIFKEHRAFLRDDQARCRYFQSLIPVIAKTVIDQKDTGEWKDLESLKGYVALSFEKLKEIMDIQTDEDWETIVATKEFGAKTKAEALG